MTRTQSHPAMVRPYALAAFLVALSAVAGCGVSSNSTPATPSFTPPAGSYTQAQTVTISDASEGATLHCTTDGSAPTASSPVCSEPTTVSKSLTLSAIAAYPGGDSSPVASAAYTINLAAAAAPQISPAAGTYTAAQTVTISDSTAGASIYYTADGSTPSASSNLYTGPITVPATETLTAIAIAPGYADSALATAAFTINLPAPVPVITPAGGTFIGSQAVAITDPIAGATIYYTVTPAGQTPVTPTASSTAYSGPFTVTASATVSAVAVAPGYSLSAVTTASLDLVTPTPVISPAGGTFTSLQNVTISDAIAGAAIFYTVTPSGQTPSTPTIASTQYTGPIPVLASETIQAIAVATGLDQSGTATAAFSVSLQPAATPVISPPGGTFDSAAEPTVSITDTTPGASIFYTVNGSLPTAATGIAYSGPFLVTQSETVQAIAVATGYTSSAAASQSYIINQPTAATPVFSLAGATYTSIQSVAISDATAGAAIYYTLDGTTPSATHGALYSGAITVASTETINAIAIATGYQNSAVASATYTINLPPAATPIISPAGGTFDPASEPTVSITDATPGASIFYTLNGSVPTANTGTPYTMPFVVNQSETVKAIAIATGYASSAVASQVYTINQPTAATPVFSEAAGTYTSAQSISISDATSGVAIHYTLDGSTPSAASALYGGAITVSSTETINAIAIATGYQNSAVASATYTIAVPVPVISPASENVSAPPMVTITDSNGNAAIYYTLDGSTPTTNSTRYLDQAFTVNPPATGTTVTVNAIAVASGFQNASATPATFTFIAAAPAFSPGGGSFSNSEMVTLSDATPGTTIYYTLDGSQPTASSPQYTAPITLTANTTINAFAAETGYQSSSTATAAYTLAASTGPLISGTVSSGSSPVIGATVQLYAAGTSGYGAGATAISSPVTTSGSGGFSIPYTCPAAPGDQMYVVATGGSTSTGNNAGLGLMAALGSCSSLPTYSVTVNEVTTIASVYALSGFASIPSSGGGLTVGAPESGFSTTAHTCPIASIGQVNGNAGCNYTGLANAFATVTNLVSLSGGTALSSTPAYPTSSQLPYLNISTAPQARVNTLADILSTCVADATKCATLFGDVSGTNPSDTLQAALDIARNPGKNVALLYSLAPATPPYTPTLATTSTYGPGLTSAPVDFALALTFTGGGLGVDPNNDFADSLVNLAFALDASGNVWVTSNAPNYQANYPFNPPSMGSPNMIAGFNNLGAPLTPATTYDPVNDYVIQYGGYSAAGGPIEVDTSANLWLLGGSPPSYDTLVEVAVAQNPGGSPTLSQPALPGSNGVDTIPGNGFGSSLAFDQAGNLWISKTSSQFDEFNAAGVLVHTYSNTALSNQNGQDYFTFDTSGSLWSYDSNSESLVLYNGTTEAPVSTSFANAGATGLAAGAGGNIYSCNTQQTALLLFNSVTLTAPVSTFSVTPGCASPIVDGDGNFWSLNEDDETLTEVTASGVLVTPGSGYTESSSAEPPTNQFVFGGQIAVDGSGNLWIMNATDFDPYAGTAGNVLVEIVGAAAPTIQPLAVATQNGAQGTRP